MKAENKKEYLFNVLNRYHEATGEIFAIVENGKMYKLHNNKEVLKEHLYYHKIPEDGVYALSELTCADLKQYNCRIGARSKICIKRGIADDKKCGVYKPLPIEKYVFLFKNVYDFINKFLEKEENNGK